MQWSQDSQSILGETVDAQVAVCQVTGNDCTVVTRGHRPKWSKDGSRIYFLRPSGRPGMFELS